MFKSKVTCWFCNEESVVLFWKKNSWNCQGCDQYNGFKKDGDYNKVIPEMEKEVNVKYCVNSNPRNNNSQQTLLCDRCIQDQEKKLNELKKFESTIDNEEEYYIQKKKLDQIYDLCRFCKNRVNIHLRNLDQQIGNHLIRQRSNNNGNSNLNGQKAFKSNNFKPKETSQNGEEKILQESSGSKFSICENLKSISKKAYTIAGTVPNYVFKTSPKKDYKYEISPAISNRDTNKSFDSSQISEDEGENTKSKKSKNSKINCNSLTIVCEDVLIFFFVLLVFACDLANLVNDSGVLLDENINYDWLQTLLALYKQITVILTFITALSIHLAYKRPKISRFLMLVGYLFNLMIHFHVLDFRTEEQYITEVFISFFLTSYLMMARMYNIFQLVRYIGLA